MPGNIKKNLLIHTSLNATFGGFKILLTLGVQHIPYINFGKKQCNRIFTRHSLFTKPAFCIIPAKHPQYFLLFSCITILICLPAPK